MRSTTFILIACVISLSATIDIVGDLRITGYLTLETQRDAAYLVFGLNVMIAIAGLFTRFRLAWLLYLGLSIICMVLLSASTPLNAALLLIGFAINHYIFT